MERSDLNKVPNIRPSATHHVIRQPPPPQHMLTLSAVESRTADSNGHSSPDSGVNDMSTSADDRLSSQMSGGDTHSNLVDMTRPRTQKLHIAAGETLRIVRGDTVRHIPGPANIAMVSSNGGAGNISHHIRPPPGHTVHRLVDENGYQIILRPQHHPSMSPAQMNQPSSSGGPMSHAYRFHGSQGMSMSAAAPHQQYNGYNNGAGSAGAPAGFPPGSQQQPYPPGYHPQYHHHPMPANMHLIQVQNGGGGGVNHTALTNSHNSYKVPEERIQRGVSRPRDKIAVHQRLKNGPDVIPLQAQQSYNSKTNLPPRINMNGGSPRGHERSLDLNSCSSSTDSHDTTEDDKRLLYDILSSIQPPQVEVESRRAVVHITSPNVPDSLLPLDQTVNPEVQFQLQYTDKKDGDYKVVYEGDATTIKMQDLKPGSEYYIRLSAILDDVRGKETDPVAFITRPTAPDAPVPPKCCQRSKNAISLKWNACVDNGSKVIHYILEYLHKQQVPAGAHAEYAECYTGSKKEYKLTKLQPSQCYVFRLAAVNDCGKSEYSKETVVYTNGTAPPQPEPPHLSEATVNSLLLTWIKRPGVDKEFVLQKEEEHTGHGFLATYTGPEVSYRVDCLRKSTAYKFRLQSTNEDGRSSWSQVVTYKTNANLPDPPLRLTTKGKILSNAFRLTWDAPHEDGGAPVQTYCAQLDSGSGYQSVYDGTACECSCVNLLPGYTYSARVAARNSIGQGAWSESTSVTTKPVSPGQCGKPWLNGKPKAHFLHLKWACPAYCGGSPVTGYAVQLIKMDNTLAEVYRGVETDCVVAGLSPGRSYLLQVKAVNCAGEGEWSEPLEVISGAGVPEPPTQPTCLVKSPHTVLVSWQTPCNNGAKISEYRLEALKPSSTEYTQLYTGPDLSFEVKSLHPNSQYSFRVQAANSSGVSPHSPGTVVSTLPSSPAAVNHVKASSTANSITITWAEPADNGCEIVQYNIEYGKNLLHAVTDMSQTECTIDQLQPDTLYRVRVQAVNSIGAGAFSSQVKVNTLSMPPAPPCLECAVSSWNSVRLKWSEVDKCDQYTVSMCKSNSSSPQVVYNGVAQQCRVTKLHEQTDYYFTICARNSAGVGDESEPLLVTTGRAPPHSLKAPSIGEVGDDYCDISWQTTKPFPGDQIEYRLQLAEQINNSSLDTYKQVYQSSSTSHRLAGLMSGGTYSVRVCPVRICDDGSEPILGAYSPGTTFKTTKPQPITDQDKESHDMQQTQQSVLMNKLQAFVEAIKPEKQNQFPLLVVFLLVITGILLAGLAHAFIS